MIGTYTHPERLEVVADSGFADVKGAGDFGLRPSVTDHLSDLDAALVMRSYPLGDVLTLQVGGVRAVELQVLNPVIGAIPVDVVDPFRGRQRPTKVLLHDPAMDEHGLELVAAPDPSPHIAARRQPRLHQALCSRSRSAVQSHHPAGVRAVDGDAVLDRREVVAAGLAGKCHPHIIDTWGKA